MKNILIVDDEEGIRDLYTGELEAEGYSATAVSTGTEALRYVDEGSNPDLVILDIKLEDESGLEILEQIRGKANSIPIILNSAYSTYKNDFTSWLADAYMVKSSDLTELKIKVKELLSI